MGMEWLHVPRGDLTDVKRNTQDDGPTYREARPKLSWPPRWSAEKET